ncbi:MAG: thioredoxin domain-containing protein, partial [Thermoanaerobaculia bacterium]
MPNRLAGESSPYLLQHKDNPVDWYPWGEEAFAKARAEDKPVFLSIGYSTCHWCHVMEHESFETDRVAEALNRDFVAIKVDREERPDVDDVYMQAVQMMTGSGGWPLSLFLAPDGRPFYGGTYFPPDSRWGRPGFVQLLDAISNAWKTRRDELESSANEMLGHLRAEAGAPQPAGAAPGTALLDAAVSSLTRQFDPEHGGFGGAPKFPPAMRLELLIRAWLRSGSAPARQMVEKTLREMAAGGMYDQVGGGFHRYSVDARWLVPHFEKMLYDNAMLARLYVLAHRAFGGADDARVARETLDYLLAEMTPEGGGFFAAQDADSGGAEGTFYVWNPASLE